MKYYLGPILWMALIFFFSTDFGSATHTNTMLAPIVRFFAPDISRREMVLTLLTIRKAAHVTEYAILSILWFYALNQGKKGWAWRPIVGAIGISVMYAGLDEFHQTFVRSRTASVQDVGIDSIGALLGQGISQLSRISSIKAKFFGWWFAWGIFSTLLVLIVLKGGHLSFRAMVWLTVSMGLLTGTAGVLYYVRRR